MSVRLKYGRPNLGFGTAMQDPVKRLGITGFLKAMADADNSYNIRQKFKQLHHHKCNMAIIHADTFNVC